MKWGGLMNNESFWDSFLQSINNKVNSISFSTWFADCKLKSMDASSIVIEASTKFKKDFLSQKFDQIIEETIYSITGKDYDISITCPEESQVVLEPKKTKSNELIDTSYQVINSNLINKINMLPYYNRKELKSIISRIGILC